MENCTAKPSSAWGKKGELGPGIQSALEDEDPVKCAYPAQREPCLTGRE